MRAAPILAPNRGADEAILAFASPEPAIDLVHLARQTDGDEALEGALLALFDRQCADLAERLADADLTERTRADIAHRLRGSALAIGAARVATAAQVLERATESCPRVARDLTRAIHELAVAVAEARAAIADLRD